jgi:hypothetical protein
MDSLYIGAYWKVRKITMREYADSTKQFLQALCKYNPVFNELFYVGRKPNSAVKLLQDFDNLDDLIYNNAWDPKVKYKNTNPDGRPSWETDSKLGFNMTFDSGRVTNQGGVEVSISAGKFSAAVNNVVLIYFPTANHPNFFQLGFHQAESIVKLFRLTVNFWKPETALLTSKNFRKKVAFDRGTSAFKHNWNIGFLTYLENPDVIKELPPDVDYHRLEAGGVMIVTSSEFLSIDSPEIVEKGVRIRDNLYQKGLLEKRIS